MGTDKEQLAIPRAFDMEMNRDRLCVSRLLYLPWTWALDCEPQRAAQRGRMHPHHSRDVEQLGAVVNFRPETVLVHIDPVIVCA